LAAFELDIMATRGVVLSPKEIVDEWVRAFNARDADAMVALYSDDATHTSPKLRTDQPSTGGRIVGKVAMKEWWSAAFQRSPGMRYDVVTTVADDHTAVIEYVRMKPGEAPLRVAEVFEIRAGRIVRSHVFHG
jgi:hypothetical protein